MSLRARLAWWLALGAIFGAVGLATTPAHGQAPDLEGWYEVTAYTCPPHCGATASGAQVGYGHIAAPGGIPFGTPLLIDGWYAGTVTDRGGDIRGRRLDIWLPSYAQAMQWGRRWAWVTWNPPPPEPITEEEDPE